MFLNVSRVLEGSLGGTREISKAERIVSQVFSSTTVEEAGADDALRNARWRDSSAAPK